MIGMLLVSKSGLVEGDAVEVTSPLGKNFRVGITGAKAKFQNMSPLLRFPLVLFFLDVKFQVLSGTK